MNGNIYLEAIEICVDRGIQFRLVENSNKKKQISFINLSHRFRFDLNSTPNCVGKETLLDILKLLFSSGIPESVFTNNS